MRILAVGWENLASLARGPAPAEPGSERLLWLNRPPLSQVGVFAITGPTGAGKTTILDAICLALFNATPRLGRIGGVRVGRSAEEAEIASFDTRNLLRRGAGEGHALCIFEGRDGEVWRATWRVRRARRSPSGRLQQVEMELRKEGAEAPVGRTKREVLAAIEQRLGLDFEQFRRSVLLAQGDFAAFLSAAGDERADLLEKVTGTGIYARLGRAAFVRAGREEQALAVLRSEQGALGQLEPEARTSLEEQQRWKAFCADQADYALEQAQITLRRDKELRRLRGRAATAREEASQAATAWDEAQDARTRRARWRLARQAAPLVAAVDQATTASEVAAGRRARARTALEQAEQAARVARGRWLAAARAATGRARRAVMAEEAASASALEERGAAERWLADHAEEHRLATQWDALEGQLVAAGEAAERLAGAEARRGMRLIEQEEAQEAFTSAEAAVRAAGAGVAEARREVEERRGVLGEDRALLDAELGSALADEARLHRLHDVAEPFQRRVAAEAQWRSRARKAQRRADEAGERIVGATASREAAQAQLPGLEAALRQARATVELAQHRDVLVDGEACPLCGATDHPYAEDIPEVASILEALQAQLDGARRQVEEAVRGVAAAQASLEAATADGVAALEQAELQRDEATRLRTRWEELTKGLSLPGPDDAELDAAVTATQAALAERLASIRARVEARDARERALTESEAALTVARESADAARVHRDVAQKRLLDVQRAEQDASAQSARDEATLTAAQASLGDEDAAGLRTQPGATLARLRDQVRAVGEAEARRAAAEERRLAAEARLAAARTAAAVVESRCAAAEETVGRDAEPEWDGPVEDEPAEAARADAAGVARDAAAAEVERAIAALVEREEAVGAAARAVAEAARAQGMDEAAFRAEVLASVELPALEERLAALEQRRDLTAGVAADRHAHLAEQEALPHPPLLPGEAREVLWTLAGFGGSEDEPTSMVRVRAETRTRAVHESLGRLRQRLAADDEARARGEELTARLAAQTQRVKLWAALRELIGDAQGKRYRSFAQSLTLDLLLTEANHHLEELEPRYRLERAPPVDGRALLALQVVDRDMGDEIRPTSSLSGGEGFLVSLALALGLSSLSADGSTIGSLFIDEGFGTLDEKTLETALSVLESLQAGGRQVGIISHVQKLAENIGAQVIVQPESPGLSRVVVAGPGYS